MLIKPGCNAPLFNTKEKMVMSKSDLLWLADESGLVDDAYFGHFDVFGLFAAARHDDIAEEKDDIVNVFADR